MNNEQQRIAIAEACGWSDIRLSPQMIPNRGIAPNGVLWVLPDYLSDLNAMHAAEKVLTPDQLWYMTAMLAKVVPASTPLAHATATQRAEAFLRCLDLWTDAPPPESAETPRG